MSTSDLSNAHSPSSRPTPVWLWGNALGVDVPLLAVVLQELFAHALGTPLFWAERLFLFSGVYALYLADHLLDTRGGEATATSLRHQFVEKNRRLGMLLCGVAAGTSLVLLATAVPSGALGAGLPVAICVAVYGLWRFQHLLAGKPPAGSGESEGFLRSMIVAGLFTSGAMMLPLGLLLSIPEGLGLLWLGSTAVLALNHGLISSGPLGGRAGPSQPVDLSALSIAVAGGCFLGAFVEPGVAVPLIAFAVSAATLGILSRSKLFLRLPPPEFPAMVEAAVLLPVTGAVAWLLARAL